MKLSSPTKDSTSSTAILKPKVPVITSKITKNPPLATTGSPAHSATSNNKSPSPYYRQSPPTLKKPVSSISAK